LVTYDEHGGYGHPDHVQVHRVGMRAADMAGTGVVYMATMNRDFVRSLGERIDPSEIEVPDRSPEEMENMGEPAERLTTEIDVTPWIGRKHRAMEVHASQISETSFFLSMSDDVFSVVWGHEWYIRVRPPWNGPTEGHRETGFLLEASAGDRGEAPAPQAR
jgi:LmbE family N-acetylglucosaminyl deacetylase